MRPEPLPRTRATRLHGRLSGVASCRRISIRKSFSVFLCNVLRCVVIVVMPNVQLESGPAESRLAVLVNRGLALFKSLVAGLDDDVFNRSVVVSFAAKFKLWAGSLGAHRSSGSRSLEYRLRDASFIRNHILSLLQDLCESLNEGEPKNGSCRSNALTLASRFVDHRRQRAARERRSARCDPGGASRVLQKRRRGNRQDGSDREEHRARDQLLAAFICHNTKSSASRSFQVPRAPRLSPTSSIVSCTTSRPSSTTRTRACRSGARN